jgi:GGDEF domain-containing protein
MLSLKVFDRSSANELPQAYRRATLLILEAISNRGMAGDESDLASFRTSLAAVITQLSASNVKAPDVLVAAGAATTAIQEHYRNEVAAVRGRIVELQAVVSMLTQTMTDLALGSEQSLNRLRDLERRLAKSHENYDVRELRQQMADCLATVREESACRKKESDKLFTDLQAAVNRSKPPGPAESATAEAAKPARESPPAAAIDADAIERSGIEALIEQTAQDGPPLFVAVLVIDHLKTIAARFGEPAAARVASFCAEQAKTNLRGAMHVGVWKGSACVALLDGTAGTEVVERAVMIESQRRRSMTLEMGQRDVMLQASYSKWSIFPASGRPASAVLQNMTAFLAQASGQ